MNINPELYDATNKLQLRDGLQLLEKIREDQCKGILPGKVQTVIDIGCGTGNITDRLEQFIITEKVIGLDISEEMISFARNHHLSPSISYSIADICSDKSLEKLPLHSSDIVISVHCFHWILDSEQEKAMANIHNLLKPGGMCYLLIFSWSDLLPLQEQLVYHPKWRQYFKHVIGAEEGGGSESLDVRPEGRRRRSSAPFPTFDPPPSAERIRDWEQRCSHLSFEDVHVTLQKVSFDFGDWNSFQEELKSICHFLPHIPQEERHLFLEDYYEHVKTTYSSRQARKNEEPCVLDYEYLIVQARRPGLSG